MLACLREKVYRYILYAKESRLSRYYILIAGNRPIYGACTEEGRYMGCGGDYAANNLKQATNLPAIMLKLASQTRRNTVCKREDGWNDLVWKI